MSSIRKPIDVRAEREKRARIITWLETQRGRPQYRTAPQAGRATARVLRPLAKSFKNTRSARSLTPDWPKIVGARWAKLSRPEKFTGRDDNRTLLISAPGAAASLIMASAEPIIERVNGFLGTGYIQRIKVIQTRMAQDNLSAPAKPEGRIARGLTPSEETALQSGLDKVRSDDLRLALETLGRHVLTRPRS